MKMWYLNQVFVISVVFSLSVKTFGKELVVDHGADDDDWSKIKWDSILEDRIGPELQNKASTDDPNKLDELFSPEKNSNKNLKSNLKLSQSQLEDFSEDEVFIARKGFHKRSGADNSVIPIHKGQINPEKSSNSHRAGDDEFSNEVQHIDSEGDFNDDAFNENTKSKEFAESSNSSLNLNSPELQNSTNTQRPNNIDQSEISDPSAFIFNPNAEYQEEFQNCTTPRNETGTCKYLQHCLFPNIVASLNRFLEYVCIIDGRYIGVCCPHFPVSVVVVKDQEGHAKEESELNENDCGVATNTRIVGGSNADPKAWPWMVALFTKSRKRFFCGGALINDRYVLTAAHCTFSVPNNEIVARVGEYDFKDNGKTHEEYAVVEMKRHGHYNRRTLKNDIALLKLEKPVFFNEFVKTICFPEEENDYVGEKATLAGWGNLAGGGTTSDVLQQASFPVISNDECSKGHGLPITESLICTGSEAGDKGACNGDSGGPLMLLDKNDRWKAIGLVSWGRRGCNPEFPTVYTRVSYFLDWIEKHAR